MCYLKSVRRHTNGIVYSTTILSRRRRSHIDFPIKLQLECDVIHYDDGSTIAVGTCDTIPYSTCYSILHNESSAACFRRDLHLVTVVRQLDTYFRSSVFYRKPSITALCYVLVKFSASSCVRVLSRHGPVLEHSRLRLFRKTCRGVLSSYCFGGSSSSATVSAPNHVRRHRPSAAAVLVHSDVPQDSPRVRRTPAGNGPVSGPR